jgi:membrane-associated phospholipid phosphatase
VLSLADEDRRVEMPGSSSFPSGHTASAFAFATAISRAYPLLALPSFGIPSAVGYSRVHAGVHCPGDVIAGAILGSTVASMVLIAARPVLSHD